jgi:hypothetical protein
MVMALACAELIGVCRFAVEHRTTGDLFYGPWLGARRSVQGIPVYDLAGLEESVNASPFTIALLRPWANTAVERFLPGWLSASVLALIVFVVYAWLWLRLLFRDRQARPGLAHLGLIVAATVSFTSLQRSLRLGQLDSFVLCLLAAGTYHASRCMRGPEKIGLHGFVGGLLLVVATGVKILPGVALLGLSLAAWPLRRHLTKRSLGALFFGGLVGALLVAGTALGGLGVAEIERFFSGLPLMLRGSAAGANYAVVARFAKYIDPSLRLSHAPLSASTLLWLWPLRALGLLALAVAARRLKPTRLHLLFALSLALLPLFSSLVWDVYFVWCAFFPWLLLLVSHLRVEPAGLAGRGTSQEGMGTRPGSHRELAHGHRDRPLVRVLGTTLLAGAYFLMGVAGTGLVRNPVTNRVADTGLPLWFDEARLVGLFMVIGMLVWDLIRPEPAIATSATSTTPETAEASSADVRR